MTLAWLLLVTLVAAFTQGVTGFGNALVAVPLLALVFDLPMVVPLTILNGLVITLYLSWRLWPHVRWRRVLPLAVGCVPGVLLGARLLRQAPVDVLRFLLGLVLVSYCAWSLARPQRLPRLSRVWAWPAGFLTGLIGALLSAGGPPAIIYATLTGWSKDEIKATLTGFFVFTGLTIGVAHWHQGLTTPVVLRYFSMGLPAVLAGVVAGSALYDRMDTGRYLRLVLLFLLATGLLFIATSLVH